MSTCNLLIHKFIFDIFYLHDETAVKLTAYDNDGGGGEGCKVEKLEIKLQSFLD